MSNLARLLRSRAKASGYAHTNELFVNHKLAYTSWHAMRTRCNNSKNNRYEYYGGKGIKVCERWVSFKNFLEDMGDPPVVFGQRFTLERKDGNKDYEKDNCIWASPQDQANNRNYSIKG